MLMMRPSGAMNAIDSGMNVFFIQNPCGSGRSKTNTIPWSGCRLKRCMRPDRAALGRRRDLGDDLVAVDRQRNRRQRVGRGRALRAARDREREAALRGEDGSWPRTFAIVRYAGRPSGFSAPDERRVDGGAIERRREQRG